MMGCWNGKDVGISGCFMKVGWENIQINNNRIVAYIRRILIHVMKNCIHTITHTGYITFSLVALIQKQLNFGLGSLKHIAIFAHRWAKIILT